MGSASDDHSSRSRSRPHVAVVAFPFGSHPAPLLALARALASASAPDATFSFLGTPRSLAALRRAGGCELGNLRFVAIPEWEGEAEEEEGEEGDEMWRMGRSAAYVGFGTVATPPPAELAALANGLESSRAPFVWSLKEGAQELLPPGFSDRLRASRAGLVVSWAPQKAVLGHAAVGAFVSHGGWNSVLESAAAGVPMVCRPFFGDHRMNARAVEGAWGIGVALSGGVATEGAVAGALDAVLRGEEGRRMRERAREIKAAAVAAAAIGGSSSENLKKLLKIVCG